MRVVSHLIIILIIMRPAMHKYLHATESFVQQNNIKKYKISCFVVMKKWLSLQTPVFVW